MKFTVLLFSIALTFTQSDLAQNVITPANRVELFNGKDFTGWTFYMKTNADPMQTWSMTNGMIHCTGKPTGYMRTEKIYQDFKVTVEWRFTKAGNTGVLVFMQDRDPAASPGEIWPQCVECQGMHGHQGDFWLWGGAACQEPFNLNKNGVAMLQPSNENPAGEWNTYQVICSGNTVEIVVNGKTINNITGCDISSGGIGIQSEGAGIDVRKVTLEPLQ